MLPPGPRLPAVFQTLLWAMCPTQLLDWCDRRYATPFTLHLAHVANLIVLADPTAGRT